MLNIFLSTFSAYKRKPFGVQIFYFVTQIFITMVWFIKHLLQQTKTILKNNNNDLENLEFNHKIRRTTNYNSSRQPPLGKKLAPP